MRIIKRFDFALGLVFLCVGIACAANPETAQLTYAPDVPPPIARKAPAVVRVDIEVKEIDGILMGGFDESSSTRYRFWTFNGKVPGPFVRVRQGDTIELHLSSSKGNTVPHNMDMHAVMGPGGGAKINMVQPGETKVAQFQMLKSGLYLYHCGAPPMTDHVANGMYGLVLVDPPDGLPKVQHEFYVMKSEFYTKEEFGSSGMTSYDRQKAAAEQPTYVVFNGRQDSLIQDGALLANAGETVRIFFGNAGPNQIASFHVIGTIFDKVYRDGSVTSEPERDVQTALIPAGGAAIVEFMPILGGDYTLVDHSLFRTERGAMGTIKVSGPASSEFYKAR